MPVIEFHWDVTIGQLISLAATSILFLVLYAVTLLRQGGLIARIAHLEAQIDMLRGRMEKMTEVIPNMEA